MILIDANILLYATMEQAREHRAAQEWLLGRLDGSGLVGFPWASVLAFVRIASSPRVWPAPLSLAQAWDQVTTWLAHDTAWVPMTTNRHSAVLGELLRTRGLRSDDVGDAHLAALAIEHGLVLCSADAGFARFKELRWENPLA